MPYKRLMGTKEAPPSLHVSTISVQVLFWKEPQSFTTELASALILAVSAFRIVRNKFLLFISHPVLAILLLQHYIMKVTYFLTFLTFSGQEKGFILAFVSVERIAKN